MRARASYEVKVFLDDAERRQACLESSHEHLRRLLEARTTTGELVSPFPRLYARRDHWHTLGPRQRALHILRGLHELHLEWRFCGISAAVAHGLWVSNCRLNTVQIASTTGRRRHHAGRVQTLYMAQETFVRADGLPVTSLVRTTFDCMRSLSLREAVAIADSALRQSALTREELVSYVAEKGGRYRGAHQAALAAWLADPLSESGGESVARAAIYELGFAAPDLRTIVADPLDPTRTYRADFHWTLPDSSDLFGELDGREKYVNPQMNDGSAKRALLAERRRESRMTAGRGRIMRFSPDEMADAAFFSALLDAFGVPRDHEPLIEVPTAPAVELVPADAYGL